MKLNKYQEALTTLSIVATHELVRETCNYKEEILNALSVMDELVNKATPKIYSYSNDIFNAEFYCPSCFKKIEGGKKFCCECGQAIYWSNEVRK